MFRDFAHFGIGGKYNAVRRSLRSMNGRRSRRMGRKSSPLEREGFIDMVDIIKTDAPELRSHLVMDECDQVSLNVNVGTIRNTTNACYSNPAFDSDQENKYTQAEELTPHKVYMNQNNIICASDSSSIESHNMNSDSTMPVSSDDDGTGMRASSQRDFTSSSVSPASLR